MTSPKRLTLLAAALMLAATGAQATSSFSASASVGGLIGTGSAFPVVCTTPTCNSTVFNTGVAELSGSHGPDPSFSASAWAQAADELTLRGRASLSLSGMAFAGADDHAWFANTLALVSTQMLYVAPSGTTPGAGSDLHLRYRFDGSGSSSGSANVDLSALVTASVSAFTSSGPVQGLPCTPDGSGFCNVTIPGLLDGESFSYDAALQVNLRATALAGSALPHSATMNYDYSRTFALESVVATDSAGVPLAGWSLYLEGASTPIFGSPVPEPATGALLLAGLLWVARASRRAGA